MALSPDGQAVVESKSVAQQATNQGAAPVGETSDLERWGSVEFEPTKVPCQFQQQEWDLTDLTPVEKQDEAHEPECPHV